MSLLTCFEAGFFVHIKNNILPIVWLKKKAEKAPETAEKIVVCFQVSLFYRQFTSICHEIDNHVSMMICWWQMRWNIFCYHAFKFSYHFIIIWLLNQTSFCKIKACRWNFISHEYSEIEISQESIVNMTLICFFSQIIFFSHSFSESFLQC